MEGAELSDGYRKLHSLLSCVPTADHKHYVSACICGWASALHRSYLGARGALTDHVLDEADKLLGDKP